MSSVFTDRCGYVLLPNAMTLLKYFTNPTLQAHQVNYHTTSKVLLVPNVSHFKPTRRR